MSLVKYLNQIHIAWINDVLLTLLHECLYSHINSDDVRQKLTKLRVLNEVILYSEHHFQSVAVIHGNNLYDWMKAELLNN